VLDLPYPLCFPLMELMRLAIERIDILLLSPPVFLETPITILFHTDSQTSTQCQPTPTFTSITEIPPSMHLERKNRGLRIDNPHSPNPAFTPCGLLPWNYLATHCIDSRPETSARKPISHFSPNPINYEHHRHRRRHLLPLPLHTPYHRTTPPQPNQPRTQKCAPHATPHPS